VVSLDHCCPKIAGTGQKAAWIPDTQSGNLEWVKRLKALGADIRQPDTYGTTPLMAAAGSNQSNTVDYLLSDGAKLEDVTNLAKRP